MVIEYNLGMNVRADKVLRQLNTLTIHIRFAKDLILEVIHFNILRKATRKCLLRMVLFMLLLFVYVKVPSYLIT